MLWKGSHIFGKAINALSLKIIGIAGNGYLEIPVQTTAPTPPAGSLTLFADSTGNVKVKGADGTESQIGPVESLRIARNIATRNWNNNYAPSAFGAIGWSPVFKNFVTFYYTLAGFGGPSSWYSTDGTTWTPASIMGFNDVADVCWSPALSRFAAVCYDGSSQSAAHYSDDGGLNWNGADAPPSPFRKAVCWSPELNKFLAVGSIGNTVSISPDGIYWTENASSADGKAWNSVCWSPELSLFVAVAYSTGANQVKTSPDGITWTLHQSSNSAASWVKVVWASSLRRFVAVGSGSVMYSSDGINWTSASFPAGFSTSTIEWSPDLKMFCCVGSLKAALSTDGINWRTNYCPVSLSIGMVWSPEWGRFVMTDLANQTVVSY